MNFKVMLWHRGWTLLAENLTDMEARALKTQAERDHRVAAIWRMNS